MDAHCIGNAGGIGDAALRPETDGHPAAATRASDAMHLDFGGRSDAQAHVNVEAACAVASPWVVHIVDDDAAVCNSLKFALELDGYDVRTYAGFRELMAGDLPATGCLVVDYNLPEINGLELLRELDRREVHLPSFLITSNPSQTVRRRASDQGVAIIEKPLLGNQLNEAVRDSFIGSRPC